MLSGISYYHPQWPVGNGGCSVIEYIGLVPPWKHVLWDLASETWEESHSVSASSPTGPSSVYADVLSLSVNRRVPSLPSLELSFNWMSLALGTDCELSL